MQDRRAAIRTRSFLAASIAFNGRKSTFDGLVRDVSAGGARVETANPVAVPEVFDLVIPKRGEARPARVVWRRGHFVGVAFTGPATPP